MQYREILSDKTFIVMQQKGFGVMEAPYTDVRIVYETNSQAEAEAKAKELFHLNNTPEEIQSTWCNNTYLVIINTTTEDGKRLLEEFHEKFKSLDAREPNPNDYITEVGGIKMTFINFEEMSSSTWRVSPVEFNKIRSNKAILMDTSLKK